MKKLAFLLAAIVFFFSCKTDKTESNTAENMASDPIVDHLATANGYLLFKDVQQLNFTFNAQVNDTIRSKRSWKWYPQERKVELTESGKVSSYINDGALKEDDKIIDQKFINDSYWLLFPYQLMWSSYELEHLGKTVAPISGEELEQISVIYPGKGGYTPGDTYHLFLTDGNEFIREWTYKSADGRELSTTWEDYKSFEGITISQMHKSADGSFQLFFTDIEVIKD